MSNVNVDDSTEQKHIFFVVQFNKCKKAPESKSLLTFEYIFAVIKFDESTNAKNKKRKKEKRKNKS